MTRISKENKYIYLMGDFNLNLMNHESHQQTSEFLDIMYSNMLLPLITRPTRITSYTATLIDNIFTNHVENYLFSGLLFTDISDHLPIFCFSYEQSSETIDDKFVVFRNKSKSNFINFNNQLNDTIWEDLSGFNDPEAAYDSFLKKFKDIYNSSFPLKKVKTIKLNLKKPWVSKGLLKSINRKNNLYKKYLNNPCIENECTYRRYKNKLTFLLRNSKRLYYEKKIEYAKTNMKDTWKILNEVVNGKKSSKKPPHYFKINGLDVSSPTEIANYFCDYFTNIGPNLANKITASSRSHQSYLSGNFVNSIFFEAVTETEVIAIVNSLRPGTAAGYDGIPTWSV